MISSWLLAMLWLSPATGVAGSQSEQAIHRNVDGSQLRISQHPCDAVGNRVMRVELRLLPSSPFKTVLQRNQSCSAYPRGSGSLQDIDADGFMEYVELADCGAGPNCWRQIFKIDPQLGRADLFFEGGYARFQAIAGFYVSSGRASCCSWEHAIYRLPLRSRTITAQDLAYMISVEAPAMEGEAATCLISRPEGEAWVPIDLNIEPLRELCHLYGENVVTNPAND